MKQRATGSVSSSTDQQRSGEGAGRPTSGPSQERTGLTRDRLRVRTPNVCRWCGGAGTVALEVRIVGGAVCLRFVCRACAQRWTATAAEILPPDRRFGPGDRRRRTRIRSAKKSRRLKFI